MRFLACCLLLAASCGPIARTNPLDPKAPDHVRAKGHVAGAVLLEGGGDLATAQLIAATIEGATRYDTTIDPSGAFDIEVPSGTYHLEAKAPGFASAFANSVTVAPGETLDVGVLSLAIAKGRVVGRVLTVGPARADSPAAGASVFLSRKDGSPFSYATLTVPSGQFFLDGVAAGEYVLSANLQDFAPGEAHDTVIVGGDQQAAAGDVRLYPASAVVQVEVDGVPAAKYTKSRDITVLLLAFVERLTEMRVSADPTFANATLGDVDYKDFAARVPFTLSDADGAQTIYAQFRDDVGHETTVFSAHIVLDRVAPTATRLALAGGESAITTALVSLALEAGDDGSGIASYRLSTDGTLDSEPYHPLGSAGTSVSIVDVESLAAVGDGQITFAVEWIDRAGNVSSPRMLTALKDTELPALAFSIVNNAGVVSSRTVTLDFALTSTQPNEALTVAIAHSAGETLTAPRVAYSDPLEWTLAAGADGARDVCARVFDAAGNPSAEVCHSVLLDTTGAISGRVLYENAPIVGNVPNYSGVDVTLVSPFGAPDVVTQSDSTGAFSFTDLPSGAGYKVQLRNLCAVPADLSGLSVVAGQANDVGTTSLRLFRGYANGTATVDVGDSAGITVAASAGSSTVSATTSSSGGFTVSGLSCGTYDFVATKQSYTSRSFVSLVLSEQSFYDMSGHPLDLRTFPLGSVQLTQSTGDFDICAATGPCLALSATKPVDVRLRLNYAGGPDTYYASEDGTLPGSPAWLPFSGPLPSLEPFQLDAIAPDGQRTVYVWYRVAGVASPRFATGITLDRTAPTGITVEIDGGATYTNNAAAAVGLMLTASDALSGVKEVKLSPDDETFNEAPTPFQTSLPFTLTEANGSPATQGTHSVHVQVCDMVGNCSPAGGAPSDDIILDTLPPAGMTITLANGSATTTTTLVALAASGPTGSGAVAVRFGEVDNLSNASYQPLSPPPATSTAFTFLLSPGDGTKTVYAEFKDAAGNTTSTPAQIATVSDQVTLDTQPPGAASITLANGAAYTNGLTVSLSLLSDATATQAQVSNCPGFDPLGCNTATYNGVFNPAQTQSIDVPAGDGLKFVYARFADAAGNWTSVVNDSITLDQTAPTLSSLVVDDGSGVTSATTVTINTVASDAASGVAQLVISTDGVVDTEVPEAYVTSRPSFSLGAGPTGTSAITVTVVVIDGAGNPSARQQATVIHDGDDPELPVFALVGNVPSQSELSQTTALGVNVTSCDDTAPGRVTEVQISENSGFAGAVWDTIDCTSLPASKVITVSSPNGVKTVYLKTRDAAGHESPVASDTITLDTTAPIIVAATINDASAATTGYSKVASPALSVTATDNISGVQLGSLRLYAVNDVEPDCSAVPSTSYTISGGTCTGNSCAFTTTTPSLSAPAGLKLVYICARDLAGNVTASATRASIYYDTIEPAPPTAITVSSGSRRAYVSWSGASDANSGVAKYRVTISPTPPSGQTQIVVPATQTTTYFDDLVNYAQYTLAVWAVDNAGNESLTAKTASGAVVGSAGGRVGFTSQALPQVEMFGSAAVMHGEYLYVIQPDQIGPTLTMPNAISVSRCSPTGADCRFPSSWTSPVRLNVPELASSATNIVSLSDRLVIGFLDGGSQGLDYKATPFFYECLDTDDCTTAAGWGAPYSPPAFATTANFWGYGFAGAGSIMAVAYAAQSGTALTVKWCKHNVDSVVNACAVDPGWKGIVGGTGGRDVAIRSSDVSLVDQSPLSASPELLVDDRSLHVAWIGLDTSSGTCSPVAPCSRVRYSRCAIESDCDSVADFPVTGAFDGTVSRDASPTLARTKSTLYLAYLDIASPNATTGTISLHKCLDFPTCSSWSASPLQITGVSLSGGTTHKYRARIKLRYGNGALHLTWWDNNSIRYASCSTPDVAPDCMTFSKWSSTSTLDSDVAIDTVPDLTFAERNPIFSYVSPSYTVRLRLPFVMSPLAAGFGANETALVGQWTPVAWADDQLHYYSASSTSFNTSVSITDPLVSTSALALTPQTDYYTTAAATLGGEKSELSRVALARIPGSTAESSSTAKANACYSTTPAADAACAYYSTARSASRLWSFRSQGGTDDMPLTLRACDVGTTSCGTGTASCTMTTVSGSTCGVSNFPSGTKTVALNVIAMKNGAKDEIHVSHAGSSAGITTLNHWYLPDATAPSGSISLVATGSDTMVQGQPVRTIPFENDKVLQLYHRTSLDSLRLRYERLNDSPFTWTTSDIAPFGASVRNYAAASVTTTGAGVTVIADYGASVPMRRFHCSSTAVCPAPGTSVTTLPINGGDLYTLSMAAASLSTGDAHAFSMMRNGRVWVGYCTLGALNCDGSRWTVVPVGYGVGTGDSAATTQINITAEVVSVLYSSLSTIKLATCRSRCYDPASWSNVKLIDAPTFVAPQLGAHIFDVLNSGANPDSSTLTFGKMLLQAGGTGSAFIDYDVDGKAMPQE